MGRLVGLRTGDRPHCTVNQLVLGAPVLPSLLVLHSSLSTQHSALCTSSTLYAPSLRVYHRKCAQPSQLVHSLSLPWRTETMDESLTTYLTGETEEHLCTAAEVERLGVPVHRDVISPFLRLQDAARDAGFDLQILSGFRSFAQQLSIWNRKAIGSLSVLDSNAVPLDLATLSERELVFAILRWSALPGASRHHWGTDLDLYDQRAKPAEYEIELIPEEVNEGGMFGPLHAWLDERMAAGQAFGFFRPYDRDRQGVAPERWHLSHAPTAAECERRLTPAHLRTAIEGADMALKRIVLEHLDEIYERFVVNIGRPAV